MKTFKFTEKMKGRFGLFFRQGFHRPYAPFFAYNKSSYISGHKGIELFFGDLFVTFIYKF